MNNFYQNTTNRIQAPKEKKWTISLLLEIAKSKNFQSPDLEIEFLIDSGAKSNIYNLPTWKEIQTLRISSSKSSSKLASAQESSLINYGKIRLYLVSNQTMEQNKQFSHNYSTKQM